MRTNKTTIRLLRYSALATLCLLCNPSALGAGQAHVHGHGKLLIAQEGHHWQLEFNLPAADVVGFEHAAHSEQDKARLNKVAAGLATPAHVFTTQGGECEVIEQDIDLPEREHSEHHEQPSGEAKHAHTDHAHHEEHDSHQKHQAQHADVRLQYHLQCSGTLKGITVTLFSMTPSLGEIDAQWIVSAGQGQSTISPMQRELVW